MLTLFPDVIWGCTGYRVLKRFVRKCAKFSCILNIINFITPVHKLFDYPWYVEIKQFSNQKSSSLSIIVMGHAICKESVFYLCIITFLCITIIRILFILISMKWYPERFIEFIDENWNREYKLRAGLIMTFRNTYSIISHLVQQTQQLLENFHENSAAIGLVCGINRNTFIWGGYR